MNDYTEHNCGETINEPTPPEHEGSDWVNCEQDTDGCVDYLEDTAA